MKRFTASTKVVSGLGAAIAITLSSGVAFAVWNSPTGSGDGAATAYTAIKADITARTANSNTGAANQLYPGSSVTGTVTITNTNPYPVKVTDITPTAGSAANGACAVDTVTAAARSLSTGLAQAGGSTVPIAAGGTGVYNVTYTMIAAADTACQGQGFTIPMTVASSSS
jgi:hypothetical protein